MALMVELRSSDMQRGKSQTPGQSSACLAHLMAQLRFNILWACKLRSGCPLVAAGIDSSVMHFLNEWLRQWSLVQIPNGYILLARTSSFCRASWGRPDSEGNLGCSLSRQRTHIHLDVHSKLHQSGHSFPNPRCYPLLNCTSSTTVWNMGLDSNSLSSVDQVRNRRVGRYLGSSPPHMKLQYILKRFLEAENTTPKLHKKNKINPTLMPRLRLLLKNLIWPLWVQNWHSF